MKRWGEDTPNEYLVSALLAAAGEYRYIVDSVLRHKHDLAQIPVRSPENSLEPSWCNGMFPGMDLAVLYSMIRDIAPKRYIEIGSGNSTRIVARAIRDGGLRTEIVSIDPAPRVEVDSLCSVVIREKLEDVDPSLFDKSGYDTIVFFDGSHVLAPDSDVRSFFMDILPRLNNGTMVHIHDITLPYDYPSAWGPRNYTEQYMLAAHLLAEGGRLIPVYPAMFVSRYLTELNDRFSELWEMLPPCVEQHGCSMWLVV